MTNREKFKEVEMYPRFDIVSGHYMSSVKEYGIWIVEHKRRVRGGWKKNATRRNH